MNRSGYALIACQPIKAVAARSVAYEYYSPKNRAESQPVALAVSPRPKDAPVIRTKR
jgi:hypothetical protein